MYISKQQILSETEASPETAELLLVSNDTIASYPGMPPGMSPPYSDNHGMDTTTVFVQIIWVFGFFFIVLMLW